MKDYQERTGRKMIIGTKKILGVTRATEILLYTPMLKWYLEHRLMVKYESRKPFSWLPKEVNKARHDGNNDLALKQLGDTLRLERNSFYGKIIEDLMRHIKTMFTTN